MRSCYWPRRLDDRRTVVQMARDLAILFGPETGARFWADHKHKPDARCDGFGVPGGMLWIEVDENEPASSGFGPPPRHRRERRA